MHRKRGYSRDVPVELLRDYRLFAIVCEGSKTEPAYFNLFRYMSNRIAVDIIEEIVSDEEMATKISDKSAPRWVLDRAIKYVEKEGLSDEDSLWFVMDVDKWKEEQLREIAQYCKEHSNWNIVMSNPCFEVWLYFHRRKDASLMVSNNCKDLKNEISTFEKGGYSPHKFIPDVKDAIRNAKRADSNKSYFLPQKNETKVYALAEAILNIVRNEFDKFVAQKLPLLARGEAQASKGKKKIDKK